MHAAAIAMFFVFFEMLSVARAQPAPTPAPTEESDRVARQHFQSGRAYYERAQYQDAAREFAEAYRLSGRPALLVNLSRAYEGANDYARAVEALEQWMRIEPIDTSDTATRGVEEQRLVRLRAAAERQAQEGTQHGQGASASGGAATPATGMSDLRIATIATGASTGGLAIVAISTGVAAHTTFETLKAACPNNECPPERQGDLNTGSTLATTSTVFSAVAIAGGIATVVLLVLDLTSEPPAHADHAAVRVVSGPGEAGLALAGEF